MQNEFVFTYPAEYRWIVERGIAGFEPFTQLQPWYFTQEDQSFWATEQWQSGGNRKLFVFARRQDNDDLACFSVTEDGKIDGVLVIQGWVDNGFTVLKEFRGFWDWFKFVIDDIADWISPD
jgi:hypothetical protein